MGSNCYSDDEGQQFFDAPEDIDVMSNLESDGLGRNPSQSDGGGVSNWISSNSSEFDVWLQNPESVQERRSKFFSRLGLSVNKTSREEEDSVDSYEFDGDLDRITSSSGAVLRSSNFGCGFSSRSSSMSFCSSDESELSISKRSFSCRANNSGGGRECIVDKSVREGRHQVVCPDHSAADEHRKHISRSPPSSRGTLQVGTGDASNMVGSKQGIKKWWLKKLRSFTCVPEGQEDYMNPISVRSGSRVQKVKVRQSKKQFKELSALYIGQDIQAHRGSILTMKFSSNGQYLASAGEDGIVRVWKVVEDVRSNELDIPDIDPSCVYFTMNHLSELKPVILDKEKMGRSTSLQKSAESACVIVPPKVFRILEVPLHEFKGHTGDVLDLSWSRNNQYLLSSSVDKTARLWKVGSDHCIKVFSHNNYVTCIQFNPVDDNYFISGSIDGKVRIWEISGCQVVSWRNIKDIVTAVCYRPDGQGGIIGSMAGYCRFYDISDNYLELDAPICLNDKKKSSCKRISGLLYLPEDPCKVMVTCASSHVKILCGRNVIRKYKGQRGAGNYSCASLTADGKHIVSACEDSNVYMWNYNNQHGQNPSQLKKVQSFERFLTNASVAVPWCGLQESNTENEGQLASPNERTQSSFPFSPSTSFPYNQEFFLESYPKGSATWPEEKLPASGHLGLPATMHKSEFKFLKSSCQSTSHSHAWGMVIVTAGFDGRIRSFHNYGLPAPCRT